MWALGLIAHKLLTGQDFWTAPNLTVLLAQICYEPIPPPSARGATLGAGYDAWFSHCCARDVTARFASAGEAVSALAGAVGVPDVDATQRSALSSIAGVPPGEGTAMARTSRIATAAPRRRGVVIGMALGAAGAVGVAAWLLSRAGPAETPPLATQDLSVTPAVGTPSPSESASAAAVDVVPVATVIEPASAPAVSSAPEAASAPAVSATAPAPPSARPAGPLRPPKTTGATGTPPAQPTPKRTTDPLAGRH